MTRSSVWIVGGAVLFLAGCAAPPAQPSHPSVAPATQPSASLSMDSGPVKPMYRELLAIDLPTVVRVAQARNLDIQQAIERTRAAHGRYESSVEAIFPVIAPSVAYQHLEGVNQNANGTLTVANFNNFLPAIAIQWMLSPGRVVYDIVASKRRMEASEHQEASVVQETTRAAMIQYYDLVLAQAQLGVARQAVSEAEELLRITTSRVQAGAGLPADELRARAELAARQQDLALALNAFYQSSVALTLTLHLDPLVTLVPDAAQTKQITLVREDLSIDQLLSMALEYRPDLQGARALLKASDADKGAVAWGGLGPQLQAGYSFGGLQTHIPGKTYGLHEQQKAGVGASFALGLSTFGQLKVASANQRIAGLDVQRQLDQVRASVVTAQQTGMTQSALIPIARQQMESAQEALRLAQANLQAGTMLTLDVLEAQAAADAARLSYAQAVVRYNEAQINLLAALGVVDEQMLSIPNVRSASADAGSANRAPAVR